MLKRFIRFALAQEYHPALDAGSVSIYNPSFFLGGPLATLRLALLSFQSPRHSELLPTAHGLCPAESNFNNDGEHIYQVREYLEPEEALSS